MEQATSTVPDGQILVLTDSTDFLVEVNRTEDFDKHTISLHGMKELVVMLDVNVMSRTHKLI